MKIGNIDLGERPVMLAPMEDVTDQSFRLICREQGADLVYTEFVSADALIRSIERSLQKMAIAPGERPAAIQIYGRDVDSMVEAARIAATAKPEFIDINWGCPVKKIAGKGSGAGMLRNIPLMLEITSAVVKAVDLPVTVKTRLGWDHNSKIIVELAEQLQDCGIAALTIHGRTRSQIYTGEADWTLIGEVKNNPRMHIPIFGNGDIVTPQQAVEAKQKYGVDGILIGRGAIGNPWIFEQTQRLLRGVTERPITVQERVDICRRHLIAAVEFKGEHTAMFEMRKHYGGYFKGLYDFKQFRIPLVNTTTLEEAEVILDKIALHYQDNNYNANTLR